MLQQLSALAPALPVGPHIGVTDEDHILHRLRSHDRDQAASYFRTRETNPRRDFMTKLSSRHVRIVPAVGRDNPAIRLGAVIDDGKDRLEI